MAKTTLKGLHRVFPEVTLFRHPTVQEELKSLMMSLFQRRIEDKLREEKQLQ